MNELKDDTPYAPIPDVVNDVSKLRLDFVVEECLILELKAVERLLPIHTAQLLTYLRLTGHRLGLLVNFDVCLIRNGIRRIVL